MQQFAKDFIKFIDFLLDVNCSGEKDTCFTMIGMFCYLIELSQLS